MASEYPVRRLVPDEFLFRQDDRKLFLYRVQSGTLCLYVTQRKVDDTRAAIEFAFPGDLVGLGFLDAHTCWAMATTETCVECLPRGAQAALVAADQRARDQLDTATEQEFEHRRIQVMSEASVQTPVAKVASFLMAMSTINLHEGRDPTLVTEPCGLTASTLGLSIPTLTESVSKLRTLGLIEPDSSKGLRLKDLDALQSIADRKHVWRPKRTGPSYPNSHAGAV